MRLEIELHSQTKLDNWKEYQGKKHQDIAPYKDLVSLNKKIYEKHKDYRRKQNQKSRDSIFQCRQSDTLDPG